MIRSFSTAKSSLRQATHVIFDMDGLLLDTEWVYYKVISSISAQFGKIYSSKIRAKVLGTQQADTCKIVVQELKLPIPWEEFAEQFSNESKKLLTNCSILPGAELLVSHLHRNNIPIAVATSSSRESYELKTHKHQQFFKLFNHIVTGASDSEVKNGKPSPDIFLVCASRFLDKPASSSCLVFEDAPNGVKAATAAGMQCVMVPDKLITEEDRSEATLVLKSLQEFQPQLFGLPKMI